MKTTRILLVLLLACILGGAAEINRKTFAVSLPAGWTEDTKNDMHDPDSFVIFENSESCLFMVIVGKKSAGATVEDLLKEQKAQFLKRMTDAKSTNITAWSEYKGRGFEMEGKINGIVRTRVRAFGFEKADNVCLVIESGTLGDLKTFADDFVKIRKTFKLK
jgi:hypothetical protein